MKRAYERLLEKPSCRGRPWHIVDASIMGVINKNSRSSRMINLNLRVLQRAGSQILEQEAVKLKLTWGPQDYNDAKATGCLPRKAANREWNQPMKKNFVAVNKEGKGFEDLKTGDTEFGICTARFLFCFGN